MQCKPANAAAAMRAQGVVQGKGPFTLTMAPTRELAIQIAEVLEEAGSKCGCRCLCVYGGVPKPPQQQALRQGIELLVGTPGRLEDLMNEGSCRLNQVGHWAWLRLWYDCWCGAGVVAAGRLSRHAQAGLETAAACAVVVALQCM